MGNSIEDGIYEMKEEHFEQVRKIWEETFKEEEKKAGGNTKPPTYEKMLEERNKAKEKFVYFENRKVVGFIMAEKRNCGGYISELFVKTDRKYKKGIGTELLRNIKKKYSYLALHVYKKWDAVKWYEKKGFEINGENASKDKYFMLNYNLIKGARY